MEGLHLLKIGKGKLVTIKSESLLWLQAMLKNQNTHLRHFENFLFREIQPFFSSYLKDCTI